MAEEEATRKQNDNHLGITVRPHTNLSRRPTPGHRFSTSGYSIRSGGESGNENCSGVSGQKSSFVLSQCPLRHWQSACAPEINKIKNVLTLEKIVLFFMISCT